MKARFRVGCVPYVNARPLVAGFDQPNEFVEVVYDVPSRLPALLDSGEVDAILVSSIEYLRREDLVIAADVGILSNGPVASVRMLSKVPLAEIQTLALDESSMTSNVLAQIILAERGVRPSLVTMPPNQTEMLAACDACVLIGDKGLEADGSGLVDVDLGAAWTEMTGEPFVWALWLAKKDRFPTPTWNQLNEWDLLARILNHGESMSGLYFVHLKEDYRVDRLCEPSAGRIQKHVDAHIEGGAHNREFVFRDAQNRSGWSREQVETYLCENVRYSGDLKTFLSTFQAHLLKHGFIESARKISLSKGNHKLEMGVTKFYVAQMKAIESLSSSVRPDHTDSK